MQASLRGLAITDGEKLPVALRGLATTVTDVEELQVDLEVLPPQSQLERSCKLTSEV